MKIQMLMKCSVVCYTLVAGLILGSDAFGDTIRESQTLFAQGSSSSGTQPKTKKKSTGKKRATASKSVGASTEPESGMSESVEETTTSGTQSKALGPQGLAIGISAGWEALYGNGGIVHFTMADIFDVHGGLGYTLSGFRFGGGGGMNFFFGRSFALQVGTAITYTTGSSGKVSLTAKFTPEAGGSPEDVVGTKDYQISSSVAFAPYGGILYGLTKSFFLNGLVNYSAVLTGNKVTLGKDVKYDKNILTTNQESFEAQYNSKAEEQAAAGGIGFTVGGLLFL